MRAFWIVFSLIVLAAVMGQAAPPSRVVEKDPALHPLSPEEAMKHIKLPAGYRLELVLSEPQIREPVAIAWDGNGRMFVAEMRGYMQDINGTGAQDPVGRISLHEDTDGDGRMDRHSVYLDGLVEPRTILPVDDGLLVGEPPDLWYCRDLDGDGIADTRKKVFDRFSMRSSNVEHKANGLLWGIDNWIHVSQHGRRYQLTNRELQSEGVVVVGQWGLTRNDEGRLLFSTNGTPAIALFVPPRYHQPDPRRQIRRGPMAAAIRGMGNYQSVWPSMVTPDMQSGPGMARSEDGTLKTFTSACGQLVFRGDRLGDEIKGDYLVCEPVGRLIRRSAVRYADSGHIELTNRHEKSSGEFISSTDGNFRPVNLSTGPDGCLYIVDMYHGIIQERVYITDYLRGEILKAGYEKNVGRGRIYRVIREGLAPGPPPELLSTTPARLVESLAHPNGWWRDTAQSLLVTRREVSATSALRKMVTDHQDALGRLHALWTLDGLKQLDKETNFIALADRDPRVRAAAIRTMERLLRSEDPSACYQSLKTLSDDLDYSVLAQVILTVGKTNHEEGKDLIARCISRDPMNERILNAVAAASPRRFLVDFLSLLFDHPVFHGDLIEEKAVAQLEQWQRYCVTGTISGGDPLSVEKLLDLIAQAEVPRALSMLQTIASTIVSPGRKPARAKMIKFAAKPVSLTSLEQRNEPAIREQLQAISFMFSWPGLTTFGREFAHQPTPLSEEYQLLFDRGQAIYRELCTTCHGPDGRGLISPDGKNLLAPPLPESPRLEENREAAIQIMLHGLAGELDGKTYEGLMAPFGATNDDEWVASILTFVRHEWGNSGSVVLPSHVAATRKKFQNRTHPWNQKELNWKLPQDE